MAERKVGFIIEIKGTNVQQRELNKLTGELIKTTANTAKFRKQAKEAGGQNRLFNASLAKSELRQKALRKRIGETTREIQQQSGQFKKTGGLFTSVNKAVSNSFKQVGLAIGVAFGARAIAGTIGGAINIIKDFGDSVANLQKTTGLAKDEAIELARAVNKIDTRTSITNLLALATAAGRLGLEGKEIVDFTREVDKAFVALSDSLEGDAEEIGLTLGKLAANFDLERKFGIGEAINKIGSALNELGASSKAQEGAIVDFTQRLAGVASQAKISFADIAALGALFDETGQSVEIAASTLQKLLPAIGKNLTKFAKVAGLDVKAFRKVVEEDAFEALKLVAKGAQSSQEGLLGLTETLESFGISAARSAGIVGILAGNTDRLTELQKISNDALDEGTSITKEFNIQNNTLSARIDKLIKAYDSFILKLDEGTGAISNTISLLVGVTTELLKFALGTEKATEDLNDNELQTRQVAEAIVTLIKALFAATTGFVAYKAVVNLTANRQLILTAFTKTYSVVTGILTGKIRLATIAQKAFNVAQKANPIGLIVGLLTAAATAYFSFGEDVEDATDEQLKFNEAQKEGQKILKGAEDIDDRIVALKQLSKAQIENLQASIKEEIKANEAKNAIIKTQIAKEINASAELNKLLFDIDEEARKQDEESIKSRIQSEQGITLVQLEEGKKQLGNQLILTNKRIDLFKNTSDKLTKEEEAARKKDKNVRDKFAEERRLALLTEEQKELDTIKKRAAILLAAGVKEIEVTKFVTEETEKIRDKFRKKESEENFKEIQDRIKAQKDELAFNLLVLEEQFAKGKISEEKFKDEKLRIRKETLSGIKQILESELSTLTASLKEANIEDSLLSDEQNKELLLKIQELKTKLAELEKPVEGEKLSPLKKLLGLDEENVALTLEGLAFIGDSLSAIGNLQNTITNERIKTNNKEKDSVIKNIDAQIAAANKQGKDTEDLEKQKQSIIDANEAKNKQIAEEGFKRNKRLQAATAIISGAQAILSVLAAPPATDIISDTIIRAIKIASTAATTALQIATIAKTTLAEGGLIPGIYDGKDDVPALLSRGEVVLNPMQQARLGGVDAMRSAGVPGFQAGGAIGAPPNILPPSVAAANAGSTGAISREEALELVAEAVNEQRVILVESDVTTVQKRVAVIEAD